MTDYRARIRNLDATYTELQERRLQLEKNWKMRREYEKSYYEVRAKQIQEELIEMEKEREQTKVRNEKIITEMDNIRNEHMTASKRLKEAREILASSKIEFLKNLQRTDPRWKEKVYNRKTHELAVLEAKRKQIQALPNNAALRSVDLEIARLKQMLEGRGVVPTTYSDREKTSRKSERVMSGDQEVKRIVDSIPKPQIYRGNEDEERKMEQIERIQSRPTQSSALKRGPAFLYKDEEDIVDNAGRLSEIKEELRLSGFEEPPRKERFVGQGRETPPRAPTSNPRKGSAGKEEIKSEYEKMLELREATIERERRESEERRQQRLEDERRKQKIEDERRRLKKLEDERILEEQRAEEARRKEKAKEDERRRQEKASEDERRRQKQLDDERRKKQQEAEEEEAKELERLRQEKLKAQQKLNELSDIKRTKEKAAKDAKKGFGDSSERDQLKEMELEIEIDGELMEDQGDSGDDWENMFDSKLQQQARLTRVGGRIQ